MGGAIAGCLFVMRPHADDLHRFFGWEHLVDEAVLDVDSARVGAGKIADELLKWRRVLKGVSCEDVEHPFRLGAEAGCRELLGIFLGLSCEDKRPGYHLSLVRHFLTGVFSPFRIDSLIPGIDRR